MESNIGTVERKLRYVQNFVYFFVILQTECKEGFGLTVLFMLATRMLKKYSVNRLKTIFFKI